MPLSPGRDHPPRTCDHGPFGPAAVRGTTDHVGKQPRDRSGRPSDPDLFAFLSLAVFGRTSNTEDMRAVLGWSPERFDQVSRHVVEHKDEAEALGQRLRAKAGEGTPARVIYNASGALCALLSAGRPLTGEELARATELSAEEIAEVGRFFRSSGVARVGLSPDEPAPGGDQPDS